MKCIFVCFILLFNHFTGISSGDELTASSADFDGDKEVTVLDFLLFQDAFGTQAGNSDYNEIYDLDKDGYVGVSDFLIFFSYFGQLVESIPEEMISICERTNAIQRKLLDITSSSGCLEVSERLLSQIDTLDLRGMQIDSLRSGDFDNLPSLAVLNLDSNMLTTLPEDIFKGSNIKRIYARDNIFEYIPSNIFSGLDSLRFVDFRVDSTTSIARSVKHPLRYSIRRVDTMNSSIARPATVEVKLPFTVRDSFKIRLFIRSDSFGYYEDLLIHPGTDSIRFEHLAKEGWDRRFVNYSGGSADESDIYYKSYQISGKTVKSYLIGKYGFKLEPADTLCIYGDCTSFNIPSPVSRNRPPSGGTSSGSQSGSGGSPSTPPDNNTPDPPSVVPSPPVPDPPVVDPPVVPSPPSVVPDPPDQPDTSDYLVYETLNTLYEEILVLQNQKIYESMPEVPTVLLPEILTEQIVRDYVQEHSISTVVDFIASLPDLYKNHFTLIFDSKSPTSNYISGVHPRVVSWGASAHFILTWTTDPDNPSRDQVEFLQADPENARWIAGLIDFSGRSSSFSNPSSCQSCHSSINRPLWGSYPLWVGTEYPSFLNSLVPQTRAYNYALAEYMNPRIRLMRYDTYVKARRSQQLRRFYNEVSGHSIVGPYELTVLLSNRHAEILFNFLKSRSDYEDIKSHIICDPNNFNVFNYFSSGTYNINKIFNTQEQVQGDNNNSNLLRGNYEGFSDMIKFLILQDIHESDISIPPLYSRSQSMLAYYTDIYKRKGSAFLQGFSRYGADAVAVAQSRGHKKYVKYYQDEICGSH